MVVTRSTRSRAGREVTSESPQLKSSAPGRIVTHLESRKKSGSDKGSAAESKTAGKQNADLSKKRKSRITASLAEIAEQPVDGETSEAESNCSSVFEVQEPILRITRRRQIIITPTPQCSVRKKQKITPINESVEEEVVSEAESHASGISRVVSSTQIRRRKKAKSQRNLSQESHAEVVSDAESACSDISSSQIIPNRTARNKRKLQLQVEKIDTKIVPGNEKQNMELSMNLKDSGTTSQISELPGPLPQINKPHLLNDETYHDADDSFHRHSEKILIVQTQHVNMQKERQACVASPTEIREQNCKNLNKEAIKTIDEEKEINEKSSQLSFSELQDTNLCQSFSPKHSVSPNKTTLQYSGLTREAVKKSLGETFAVVKLDRWNEDRKDTIETSGLTQFSDHGDNEPTSVDVSEAMNNQDVLECGAEVGNLELGTSQEMGGSVLLVLSSDESQQSESSDDEDEQCAGNSGQKESSGDSGTVSSDNTLFVIDKTPGLSADKSFYLEDKASEIAIEEEEEEEEKEKEEEEDENSEESSSDSDRNKDEFSDEEDILNNTKSKLLKLTSSSIDPGLNIKELGGLYINFNADKLQPSKRILTQIKEKKKNELLQKAVITPDFEKNYCVPPYSESKHQLQKKRRKERQKTAGDGWFGMKAPELTDELKNDLKALKMRASMDPKRFYKKNDRDGFPKYFQIGTIVDNPADFYHSRVPKKQRKKTIVEELLADSEFRRFNRRKYSEIMAEKAANAAGKKFRKKKKFRN